MNRKNLKEKIRLFFEDREGVEAVYLFGSFAKNTKREPEDIDIAVLFDPKKIPDFRAMMEMREDLSADLKKEVDLVLLNTANPILKHQILDPKQLLINNEPSKTSRFFVHSLMEYDDIKRVRAPIEKNILKGRVYGG